MSSQSTLAYANIYDVDDIIIIHAFKKGISQKELGFFEDMHINNPKIVSQPLTKCTDYMEKQSIHEVIRVVDVIPSTLAYANNFEEIKSTSMLKPMKFATNSAGCSKHGNNRKGSDIIKDVDNRNRAEKEF